MGIKTTNNKKFLIIILSLIIICILSALILTLTLCNHKKTMTNITWTQDSFDYDNSDHTISVTNVPIGSTVTYTGGEDGTNGAKNDGLYTINATITNPNYKTWVGSHTLAIIFPENGIKLQDGSFYTIDTSGDFCTNRTTSGTFNFTDLSGTSQTITRADIKEMHLTDLLQITTAPNNYLKNMCNNMSNLTVADIQIPNTITSVGQGFCEVMFQNCSSLQSLPSGFNLPQAITTTSSYFCYHMFFNCSSLTSLPDGFNIPQNLTTVGNDFCADMFYGCTDLYSLPSGFNLPQNIIGSVGHYFCTWMFYGCTSLASLPDGFNLPNGITSTESMFCRSMFEDCEQLQSLPSGFNIPQGITSTGVSFCAYMFSGCSGLKNDNAPANLVTIHIPNLSQSSFCQGMFNNTGTTNPATPSPDSDVTINAN